MDYMSTPESGNEPIIPHAWLYDPDKGVFVVELGEERGSQAEESGGSESGGPVPGDTAAAGTGPPQGECPFCPDMVH